MMYDISVNDLRESSTGSLELIKRRIDEELTRRRNVERERLITAFRKAWSELKDAHIRITYCDQYEDDITYLDDWDDFSFD
jgi:hypothetical protein